LNPLAQTTINPEFAIRNGITHPLKKFLLEKERETMQESEELRRMKKLSKDTRDKSDWDNEFEDGHPKGRHLKTKKKVKAKIYDEEE